MSLWEEIAADRIAADRFLLSTLTISMMGRDWATFTVPFDFEMTQEAMGEYNVLPTGMYVAVCFPDSWGLDEEYPAALQLSCWFRMRYSRSPSGTLAVYVGFAGGDQTVLLTTSAANYQLTRTWLSGALPTGRTNVSLDVTCAGTWDALTVLHSRTIGLLGPDSYYQFVMP